MLRLITVSSTAFKKRQQGVNSDSEAPTIKEASLKVSQIEFNIVNDEGNKNSYGTRSDQEYGEYSWNNW